MTWSEIHEEDLAGRKVGETFWRERAAAALLFSTRKQGNGDCFQCSAALVHLKSNCDSSCSGSLP